MLTLHNHFKNDFGYNYDQHKDLFVQFFVQIQSYIFGPENNLVKMVESFFDKLLFRMTQILLNTKRDANMAYPRCIAQQVKHRRPFDNAPSTIVNMTMEAFPPMRLAINAMAFGRQTLKETLKIVS